MSKVVPRNARTRVVAVQGNPWQTAFWLLAFVLAVFVLTQLALRAGDTERDAASGTAASVRGDVYKSRFEAVLDAQTSGEVAR